jgi:hypothetical protein
METQSFGGRFRTGDGVATERAPSATNPIRKEQDFASLQRGVEEVVKYQAVQLAVAAISTTLPGSVGQSSCRRSLLAAAGCARCHSLDSHRQIWYLHHCFSYQNIIGDWS